MPALKAPFPYFGGKSRAASVIWEGLGDVTAYVEPFAGSLAVLLARPETHRGHIETVNDVDCYIANFWRAISRDAEAVAAHADWPVNEADLFARHRWLVAQADVRERVRSDPDYFDAKVAGWWVWGLSCWIGGGWCAVKALPNGETPSEQTKRPDLNSASQGKGVHRVIDTEEQGRRPHLGRRMGVDGAPLDRLPNVDARGAKGSHRTGTALLPWFSDLAARLRRVRVCCGDWSRVLTPAVTTSNHGIVGVFLDPPYSHAERDPSCYAADEDVSGAVRDWAIERGSDPGLRIVLAGYEGEHAMPSTWRVAEWKATGGYARGGDGRGAANRDRERLWFSPACLDARQGSLFERRTTS